MIDLIVAILLYIGAVNSSTEVTPSVIENNQSAIEYYKQDPDFQSYYESQQSSDHVGIMDTMEGD